MRLLPSVLFPQVGTVEEMWLQMALEERRRQKIRAVQVAYFNTCALAVG
jgi:hypothetical protein